MYKIIFKIYQINIILIIFKLSKIEKDRITNQIKISNTNKKIWNINNLFLNCHNCKKENKILIILLFERVLFSKINK